MPCGRILHLGGSGSSLCVQHPSVPFLKSSAGTSRRISAVTSSWKAGICASKNQSGPNVFGGVAGYRYGLSFPNLDWSFFPKPGFWPPRTGVINKGRLSEEGDGQTDCSLVSLPAGPEQSQHQCAPFSIACGLGSHCSCGCLQGGRRWREHHRPCSGCHSL